MAIAPLRIDLGERQRPGVMLDELPELRHGRFAMDDVSRGRRASPLDVAGRASR